MNSMKEQVEMENSQNVKSQKKIKNSTIISHILIERIMAQQLLNPNSFYVFLVFPSILIVFLSTRHMGRYY